MTPLPLVAHMQSFARRTNTRTEADIHMGIAAFLTIAPLGLSESHVVRLEEQTQDGTRRRIDIGYGRLVIEVKRSLTSPAVVVAAEKQLGDYMATLRERDGHDYAGVLTDGVLWILYTQAPDGPVQLDTHAVDVDGDQEAPERLRLWLETILLTGDKIKPTPHLIEERLGTASPRFKLDRARLGEIYSAQASSPDVELKRHLWARLLRTALGTNFGDDPDLFIDHTLLVLEAEIIAHLVVGIDPSSLTAREIVAGDTFRLAGIFNVVESDFFDWPAETDEGIDFVHSLVRELAQFDWDEVSHDVLKVLYEAVIDKRVRKNLGEYYTPDWLAKRMIDEVITDPLNQKVMDPACGSGTFLFHAIRRFLVAADESGVENREALNRLQDRVFGMDIHPVSAVLARVTYLLAIGRERLADRETLTIPVYLGDSMQWGRVADTLASGNIAIEVDSPDLATVNSESHAALWDSGEKLTFPIDSIDNPGHFDRLINDLAEIAQKYTDSAAEVPSIAAVLDTHGIADARQRDTLTETFAILCSLNARERDHIWGYFVRNQIRPLWFSSPERRVDVLIGNPPWVAYRFMTASMQAQYKALAITRNQWHGGQLTPTQDLVSLFIARTVEQFLQPDGTFAFVSPLAVLSRMQFEGFRKGRWAQELSDGVDNVSQNVNVQFHTSWDLKGVRPNIFPAHAAVLFGRRSHQASALPAETINLSGRVNALIESEGSTEALSQTTGFVSPYGKRALQGPTVVPHFMFFAKELPPTAIGRPHGTTEVVSARSTQEKVPWKSLPSHSGPIEKTFVKKVHSGSTIVAFRALDPSIAIFPVDGNTLLTESQMASYPLLRQRWDALAQVWDANKGKSKLSLMERLNYQQTFQKQLPVPTHRVVYTTSGTRLVAAVLDDPATLINNRLYWIATDSRAEAGYLVTILNSEPFATKVGRLQGLGLYGPRDFHTLPWRLNIPMFDDGDNAHRALSALHEEAQVVACDINLDGAESTRARKLVRDALASSGLQARIDAAVVEAIPSLS
ncbi:N-6 DNA methylase [Cryobacterium sp. Sr8]|uniref:N-6 DNA methylase n=1 Tax=Cryobacterium sp. Sr8 TaxID=1259203 RepID=UPI00141B0694|nr:N-6 DNA methylase [Cryobacterium sp. Sr8]